MDRERGLRLAAAHLRLAAAHLDLQVSMIRSGRQMRRFVETWNAGERQQFESHPDVQETVAQMRRFYDA